MVPGMTERELQALDLIRREWLDGRSTRPIRVLAERRPAGAAAPKTALALLSRVGLRLLALVLGRDSWPAPSIVDPGATKRGVEPALGRSPTWQG